MTNSENMLIRFRCPNGHKLKVAERHAGNEALCPACSSRVTVPGRAPNPITDSAVVRLLSDEPAIPEPASRNPKASKRFSLGRGQRTCPRCHTKVPASARICVTCNLYLFPTEDTWKKALRAARAYLSKS